MKQHRLSVQKVFSLHKRAIKIIFMIITSVTLFISGYLVSSNLLTKQISDSEFEFYEQVARNVYEQGEKVIYEVPDGVILERTSTSITISSKGTNRGKVTANLQSGELIFTRNEERGEAIAIGILSGILFVLISILLWIGIPYFYEKSKRK